MQRKFITNLALLLFLNLLIKPFWILGIDREVQNVVGAQSFGLYYALFNFSFLLNALLDIGITNFNNKNIAQNTHLLTKHFSNIVGLKFILALFYAIVTLVFAVVVGYKGEEIKMLLLLVFNQFLISFVLYLRSNISGLHLFKTDSLISVLDRLIMIAISVVLLWGNIFESEYKIEWFIYTQTAGYAITAIIAFLVVFNKAGVFKLTWSKPFFISILKQSYPFALLILLMMIYTKSDTIIMERILPSGAEQTGIFAQAYRLLDSANMIGFLFAGLLLPLFARMIKLNERINELVNLSLSLILALAVISATGSFFFRFEIMDLLYHEYIYESSQVFGVLMFSFIAMSFTYIFGTLLTANGNLKQLNWLAAIGVVVNIALNFYLIPRFLSLGAAISGLITNSLIALIQVVLTALIFKFEINFKLIAKIVFFSIGVVALAFFSKILPFGWITNFLIMVLTSVLWAFITGVLNIKSMYHIIKYG
ncbi:MAG: oligosaccharide flippase family protein [Bacteroidetes bacterium]|nr:oligosaccharide flippase family protein [Bacteroidota bacterium]HET6245757.1 oligosaccharide flippase family protein [Bacteroidia bacterium]